MGTVTLNIGLSESLLGAASMGDADRLKLELNRVDPQSPEDSTVLGTVVREVLRNEEIVPNIRQELALAWLRTLALSSDIGALRSEDSRGIARLGIVDRDWFIRATCAEALSYIGDETDVESLVRIATCSNEHPTVRVDALESALACADDAAGLIDAVSPTLADDSDPFVRSIFRLHSLMVGKAGGPSEEDLVQLADAHRDRWPPQEGIARLLRSIEWAVPSEPSSELRLQLLSLINDLVSEGIDPFWEDLEQPARNAVLGK